MPLALRLRYYCTCGKDSFGAARGDRLRAASSALMSYRRFDVVSSIAAITLCVCMLLVACVASTMMTLMTRRQQIWASHAGGHARRSGAAGII